MFRTRSLAKQACVRGSVRVNDSVAKPSSNVKPGDRVKVKTRGEFRELEVSQILEKRVGPPGTTTLITAHYLTKTRQQLR